MYNILMKINKKTDYAMRLLIALCKVEKVDISLVATKHNISTEYLRKVGQELVKLEVVTSKKGHAGGFSLAKKPEEIYIYDILLKLENIDVDKQCLLECEGCKFNNNCKFDILTIKAQQNFFNTYKDYTLQDLL